MNTRIDITLPSFAATALDVLEGAGHESWLVGGCVRDALLGRSSHDFDIATAACWEVTGRVLAAAGFTVHRTGVKHGTVTASLDGHAVEVTTFRTDGDYSDGRHPDKVTFVSSIREDLARRDFTINALAYHPRRGILDCWNGIEDLHEGVLRAVGEPSVRFKEDALRMLRGCRFMAQLGFRIAPDTLAAMKSQKRGLAQVSAERITHELDQLLLGDYTHDALMACVDVLAAVLPELAACRGFEQHTPYHIYDVWEHTAWVVQRSPRTRLARWAALFHDCGKPAAFFMDGDRGHFYGHANQSVMLARGAMQRLMLSPAFVNRVLELVRIHDVQIAATPKAVKRALAQLDGDVELFEALIGIKRADALAQSPLSEPRIQLADDLTRVLSEVLEARSAFTLKQLAVNGSDVTDLGIPSGPEVGRILKALLDAVIDECVPNERAALLELARKEAAAS